MTPILAWNLRDQFLGWHVIAIVVGRRLGLWRGGCLTLSSTKKKVAVHALLQNLSTHLKLKKYRCKAIYFQNILRRVASPRILIIATSRETEASTRRGIRGLVMYSASKWNKQRKKYLQTSWDIRGSLLSRRNA